MDRNFVFRFKCDEEGNIIRWKARFVVKGYSAIYSVDYLETTVPTMHIEMFCAVAHIAAVKGWELHQVGIITTFLRGKLELGEEVYMRQPKGFEEKWLEDQIWELQKGSIRTSTRIKGLEQGHECWDGRTWIHQDLM
jgi:hypothetical protein